MTPEEKAAKQRAYFQGWYARQKVALSVQRHERYHDDPAYRAKAKAASRAYRARKAAS